jgi:predicted acylesterase/phospholipase RssA
MLTLVLCGGGVKSTFQIGYLIELLQSGIEIDEIYASSMGSILAILVANKRIDLLETLYDHITKLSDPFTKWPWYYISNYISMFFRLGMYKKNNLVNLVWDKLSDQEKEIAKNTCNIATWNILEKKQEWFGGKNTSITDFYNGLTASCSLWLLVPPLAYKNSYYLDGGCCDFFPINPLIDTSLKGDQKVIFLDSCTRDHKPLDKLPTNAIDLMFNLHDICLDRIGEMQLEKLHHKYQENLMIIRPEYDILANTLDFDKLKMAKNIILGREKFKKTEIELSFFLGKDVVRNAIRHCML